MVIEYQSVDWRPMGSAYFVWAASRNGANFIRGVNYLQLDSNNKIADHVIIATAGITSAPVQGSPTGGSGASGTFSSGTTSGSNSGSTTYSSGTIASGSSTMTSVTTSTGTTSINTVPTNSWGPVHKLKHTAIIENATDYRQICIASFCFLLGIAVVILFNNLSKLSQLNQDMAERMI